MGKQIKGLPKLIAALDRVQAIAEEMRDSLTDKQAWLDEKNEKYREGQDGEEWDEHLSAVEELLDDIDNLDYMGLQ
ncbi:hypothetical protein [Pedobacter antarcticus]|uniref:hypothetical protein n=1 Tax=Pedobacter antarcticus TaxID=34086 RepID=UPI0029319373|nr:hypothetical protein [Pedobacter antarcticus]